MHAHLVRHAAHGLLGRILVGRTQGVHLSPQGRREAGLIAERLRVERIDAVYTSPRERAVETAEVIAGALGVDLQVAPELDEIDFGEWSNMSFEELARSEQWRLFNTYRSVTRAPGGESMLEAQARVVAWLERRRQFAPGSRLAIVGHGDVLRAAVAHYLGVPLDLFQRLDIDPASLTSLELNEWGPRLLRLNERAPPS